MPAPAIRLRGLTRQFAASRLFSRPARPIDALRDLTLDIAPGDIIGLLGPNGAGKTTLLEILATVLWPSSGSAHVGDYDVVRDAAAIRAVLAYCPAGASSFFPRLTGRHNLQFFLALANLPGRQAADRITAAASLAGLSQDLDRHVRTYSDGMRQRLGLARALAIDARLWLFDEPTRSLDPDAQRTLRRAIRQLAAARAATVVIATHDLHEASELCDRVVVLAEGRVLAYDRPDALVGVHGSLAEAYHAATRRASP